MNSFNSIIKCKSRLTEPSYTDIWKYFDQSVRVKHTDEHPHAQASAHPPTCTPVTSFFCGWITHSTAAKTFNPDKERSKLVKAAFQRSQKSWFFRNWAVGQAQR